jgi:hypothetical protein
MVRQHYPSMPSRLGHFTLGKITYPLNKRLGGPQTRSEPSAGEKNLLPLLGFEPRIVGVPTELSRPTVAIPTELSRPTVTIPTELSRPTVTIPTELSRFLHMALTEKFFKLFKICKGKGNVHPRTGHEGLVGK